MAIVGIYKLAVSNTKLGLTKEEMANKALPFLIPLSIENGLSVQQFNIIVNLIRDMMQKIETEHRTKLEQLHAIQDTQKSSLQMSLSENMTLSSGKIVAAPASSQASAMDSMFDGMGLGDFVNADKSSLVNSVIAGQDKQGVPTSSPASNIPKSSSSLTLQEKKQMMQQQSTAKPPPSPVNLTDSLMSKSMSMNAMSSNASKPTMNNPTWAQNSSSGWSSSMTPASQTAFGGFTSAPTTTQLSTKPDLSAFDNLLSPNTNKQPMNSMRQPGMSSMIQSSLLQPQQQSTSLMTNNNSQGAKQLSMNDINDFLS